MGFSGRNVALAAARTPPPGIRSYYIGIWPIPRHAALTARTAPSRREAAVAAARAGCRAPSKKKSEKIYFKAENTWRAGPSRPPRQEFFPPGGPCLASQIQRARCGPLWAFGHRLAAFRPGLGHLPTWAPPTWALASRAQSAIEGGGPEVPRRDLRLQGVADPYCRLLAGGQEAAALRGPRPKEVLHRRSCGASGITAAEPPICAPRHSARGEWGLAIRARPHSPSRSV